MRVFFFFIKDQILIVLDTVSIEWKLSTKWQNKTQGLLEF